MLELLFVTLTKRPWQRLVFVAPALLALSLAFRVHGLLPENERKESFISILNLPSFSLCKRI